MGTKEEIALGVVEAKVEWLQLANARLVEAFNAFFDAVAPELGFAGATFQRSYCGFSADELYSPRRLAMTQPVPEIIRTNGKKGA